MRNTFFTIFILIFKIYFNWIITSQYCDGFCHTSAWTGHRYTCVPSLLNAPPTSLPTSSLQVVKSSGFGFPASYINLPLAFYFTYGNVHVSMLFSQIIHLLLLPLCPKVCFLKIIFAFFKNFVHVFRLIFKQNARRAALSPFCHKELKEKKHKRHNLVYKQMPFTKLKLPSDSLLLQT